MKLNAKITEFLRESNAIENVWDEESLKKAEIAWNFLIGQRLLTEGVIKTTHALLMDGKTDIPAEMIGEFRKPMPEINWDGAVYVGGREGMKWQLIRDALQEWMQWSNMTAYWEVGFPSLSAQDFAKLIKHHHVKFEKIHPFYDGNGRVGRMLLNWERHQAKLTTLVIKEAEKQDYYEWFR